MEAWGLTGGANKSVTLAPGMGLEWRQQIRGKMGAQLGLALEKEVGLWGEHPQSPRTARALGPRQLMYSLL